MISPSRTRRDAVFHGLVIAGVGYALIYAITEPVRGFDASAYWSVALGSLYTSPVGAPGVFTYSPPAAMVAQLFKVLPWPVFLIGWQLLLVCVLAWLAGRPDRRGRVRLSAVIRGLIILLAFPPVIWELVTGNIHILLAAAIVVGFRFPAAWAFVLLTKVTAGGGLLWFALRREWRQLTIALAATSSIVALTFVVMPSAWMRWLEYLRASAVSPYGEPGWIRLPFAVGVIWFGARRDARWMLPIGALLALPVTWLVSLSMLSGSWALWRPGETRIRAANDPAPNPRAAAVHASRAEEGS